jgi:two-component system, cell cycle sensor histidine kinase and response regulator CckA
VLTAGLLAARPDRPLSRPFTSSGPGGVLVRRMVPVLLVPPVIDLVARRLGSSLDPGILLAMTALAITVVLGTGLGYLARRLDLAAELHDDLNATLGEQERSAASVLNAMHDGVILLDAPSGLQIVDANPRACLLLGRSREEILGLRPPFPWWPEGSAAVARLEQNWQVTAGAVPYLRYEEAAVRPDGTCAELAVSLAAVHGPTGAVTRIVACYTDLTDRIRADELQQQVSQLARLDSLGKLTGGIAHDFNNLLVVIGGRARILAAMLPPDSQLRAQVAEIISAAAKGDTLTRQLLAYGRGSPDGRETIDLGCSVAALEPLLRTTIGEHVELRVEASGARPSLVQLDKDRLNDVLLNLATNARDAMPTGGTLRITSGPAPAAALPPAQPGEAPHPDPGDWVRLTVADTGHGMDAYTLRRAIDPFFTTKPGGQGTGLGLASVYGIVKAAGGRIRLDSAPRQGTRIELFLPAAPPEAATPPAVLQPTPRPRPGTHVLVVEDQPDVAGVIATELEQAGLRTTVTTRPADALRILDVADGVDVLLTDVIMPGLTGPQLASQLRQRHPDLPVLFMSGYTSNAVHGAALPAGSALIAKPFSPDELLAAMARVLAAVGAPAGKHRHRSYPDAPSWKHTHPDQTPLGGPD